MQTRTEKLAAKFRACEEQISKVQVDKETKTKVGQGRVAVRMGGPGFEPNRPLP